MNVKKKCPECSHNRQNKADKPLSVETNSGLFKCHHCGWKGRFDDNGEVVKHKVYFKPDYQISVEGPTDKLLSWFQQRGISPEVVRRNRIEVREVRMPGQDALERVIAFPYFRDSEIVNVKYRTPLDKRFRMETGAELILYGLDDIQEGEPLIFVEGELDKLALETAGYRSCVSVPNGSGTNLDLLGAAEPWLKAAQKIVVAGDADDPGRRLQSELVRRLGPERCYRVEWPEGSKDANDVLLQHGVSVLRGCIESSRPVPIEGAFEIEQILPDIVELYQFGRPRGEHPGWDLLEPYYRPRPGDWTVVTGSPGSGKSSIVAALAVNLAIRSDWQFVVYPPENLPPQEYASILMEIWAGEPFNFGPNPRMSKETMLEAASWVNRHFVILNPKDGERDLSGLLKLAKSYVFRRGIKGLVIDPWNQLEHFQSQNQTQTQYIGESLIRVRDFCRVYGVHTWIVAHPTKLKKENDRYPVATLYDVEGSAHWFNMSDMGLSIWRDKTDDSKPVEVHVQKVRFRWCGQLGMVNLYFDKSTGRYFEQSLDGLPPAVNYYDKDSNYEEY